MGLQIPIAMVTITVSELTGLAVYAIAADRMTEAFGLYALAGKATSFLAPTLIGVTTAISQSQPIGVTPLIALFLIGLALLRWVDPEGDRPCSDAPPA